MSIETEIIQFEEIDQLELEAAEDIEIDYTISPRLIYQAQLILIEFMKRFELVPLYRGHRALSPRASDKHVRLKDLIEDDDDDSDDSGGGGSAKGLRGDEHMKNIAANLKRPM